MLQIRRMKNRLMVMVCGTIMLSMFLVNGCGSPDKHNPDSEQTVTEMTVLSTESSDRASEKENPVTEATEHATEVPAEVKETEAMTSTETEVAGDTTEKEDSTEAGEKKKKELEVPNLVGLSQEEAMAKLESYELIVEAVSYTYSDTTDSGNVIDQSIPAGTVVGVDTNIAISISKGLMTVIMPDVSGMTIKTAKALLEADGFKVSTSQPDDVIVSSQNYVAGDSVQKGTTITIK